MGTIVLIWAIGAGVAFVVLCIAAQRGPKMFDKSIPEIGLASVMLFAAAWLWPIAAWAYVCKSMFSRGKKP